MTATTDSPFHRGEQAIQRRVGVRDKVEEIGRRNIRDHMPEQHRTFYTQLPFLLLGSVNAAGRPWASMLTGEPGFVSSPDPRTLRIDVALLPGDPANESLAAGAQVGVLGIEFHTRRRNRMNGRITSVDAGGLTIAVNQSFGNCPMYIQARTAKVTPQRSHGAGEPADLDGIDDAARRLIETSDSFFIATQFAEGDGRASDGVDVSHRGGRPGFVRVDDQGTLSFPDFTGNTHFNTLGNILLNPRAGLLFIDYEAGDLLYLTGRAEIVWEGEELAAFTGAERLVRFFLDQGRRLPAALPMRWSFLDYSPVLEQTGSWDEVEAKLATLRDGNVLREYTVTDIEKESANVRSFYLGPVDGGAPPSHVAGQFLPLELHPPGTEAPIRRTYTISNAPDGEQLRLSIKREPAAAEGLPPGLSSSYFHDHVGVGTVLKALAPRGCFRLDTESCRPVVMLSAGVGVTPMVAMLEQLVGDAVRCGPGRGVWFVHGARNGLEHAFARHVRELADRSNEVYLHFAYSAPNAEDIPGRDYDSTGRIDIALLRSLLPFDDYDFYICGPTGFMRSLYDGLRALNVADDRIHYEFFGPAAKLGDSTPEDLPLPADAADRSVPVRFARADIDAEWEPGRGTLLDLAEAVGLSPPYSCRSGICQTCATPVQGAVSYAQAPMVPPADGEALICCAYPAASDGDEKRLVIDL